MVHAQVGPRKGYSCSEDQRREPPGEREERPRQQAERHRKSEGRDCVARGQGKGRWAVDQHPDAIQSVAGTGSGDEHFELVAQGIGERYSEDCDEDRGECSDEVRSARGHPRA